MTGAPIIVHRPAGTGGRRVTVLAVSVSAVTHITKAAMPEQLLTPRPAEPEHGDQEPEVGRLVFAGLPIDRDEVVEALDAALGPDGEITGTSRKQCCGGPTRDDRHLGGHRSRSLIST
ncbi:hypothetical protein ABZ923_09970 [Streptomyces sp. NPDC046881]|uniref:hypothetical protein n=1 Tax=Streptomyces sp. NPDC046881 TaxID=3155374 RepID=UPI0033E92EEA